jgi:WD40 repeat protein
VPVGPVRCLKFSPDGTVLASGSGQVAVLGGGRDNGSICVWHVETGKRIWGRVDATEPVLSVDFSSDGGLLFSSTGWPARSRLNVTALWDAATGAEICRYSAHRQPVFSGIFAGAARRLLLGGRDRLLRLWDAALEQEVHRFEGHQDAVFCVALSPDGTLAASASADRTIRIWRLPAEES